MDKIESEDTITIPYPGGITVTLTADDVRKILDFAAASTDYSVFEIVMREAT